MNWKLPGTIHFCNPKCAIFQGGVISIMILSWNQLKKPRSQFETRGFWICGRSFLGPERQHRLQGTVAPGTDISNRPGSALLQSLSNSWFRRWSIKYHGVCCGVAPGHIREIAEKMGPKSTAIRKIGTYTSRTVTTRALRNTLPNTGIRRDIELFNIYDLSTNEAYLFWISL